MGEGIEVEVWNHEAEARCDDNGEWHYFNEAPEGSLTAARLRLADAAEAYVSEFGSAERDEALWGEMEMQIAIIRTKRGQG